MFGGKDADWFFNSATQHSRLLFNPREDSEIPMLMDSIFTLYGQKDLFMEFKAHRLMTELLVELCMVGAKTSGADNNRQYVYPDPVNIVIKHVEQNYFRKIALKELAALTFLNEYYLLKLFKKHTGYTPGEYINKFRLDYSKQLLVKPEMTIEQIALFLGFNTHSYFSKLFKRNTGLAPTQFRMMYGR